MVKLNSWNARTLGDHVTGKLRLHAILSLLKSKLLSSFVIQEGVSVFHCKCSLIVN